MPINYLIIKSISNWCHPVLFRNFLVLMTTVWDNINRFVNIDALYNIEHRTCSQQIIKTWNYHHESLRMNWLLTLKTYLHTTNKRHFLSFKSILSMSMSDMVSVKLPPKKIPPHNCLSIIAHWENWPLHDCPGLLLPDNYHKDNCPPLPDNIPLETALGENCLSDNLSPT